MAHRTRLALLALLFAPLAASGATLGRLALYSMVGEPLNAEIEIVSIQPSEAQSLATTVAPADVYRQAQVAPLPRLDVVRVAIDRKPDGRYFVKVTSTEPVDKPLVNLLVELSWGGGGIVRQYSFLLDSVDRRSPAVATAATPPTAETPTPAPAPAPASPRRETVEAPRAPAAPVAAAAPPPEATVEAPRAPSAPIAALAPPPEARDARDSASPATSAAPATAAPGAYAVQPGDTLGKIAQATLYDGVTVPQMSVAIFRANEDAFLGRNMNRLKSGRTLQIPDREAAAAVTPEEAGQVIAAQRAPADDVRSRPAGAAAAAEPSGDDLTALDRAIAESKDRATALEQTLAGLKELIDARDKEIAELQRQLPGKAAAKSAKAP